MRRKNISKDAVPDSLVQFVWEVVDRNGGHGTEQRLIKQFKKKLRTSRVEYGKALMAAAVAAESNRALKIDNPAPPKKQRMEIAPG